MVSANACYSLSTAETTVSGADILHMQKRRILYCRNSSRNSRLRVRPRLLPAGRDRGPRRPVRRPGPDPGPRAQPVRNHGALFKTPCDREEEKRAGGIECVLVSGVRTAIVGVEHLPVLEVGYEPLDRCAKR